MYCFFNKFFFKVEIFGNLPIFCHAHLVAIQDFVDREILFDRCGKCPMLCLFFDFKLRTTRLPMPRCPRCWPRYTASKFISMDSGGDVPPLPFFGR